MNNITFNQPVVTSTTTTNNVQTTEVSGFMDERGVQSVVTQSLGALSACSDEERPSLAIRSATTTTHSSEDITKLNAEVDAMIETRKGNINGLNKDGRSLLHEAISNNNLEHVKILIERGANINIKACQLKPLNHAVDIQNKNIEIIQLLIDAGANIGDSLSWVAMSHEPISIPIAELLINHGANFNDTSIIEGMTPLGIAVKFNNLPMAELFLNKGDRVDRIYNYVHLVHFVVSMGNIDMIRLFIKHGADINTINDQMKTPLHVAIDRGDVELTKLLLENGAYIGIRYVVRISRRAYGTTIEEENTLDVAKKKGNPEIIALLEKARLAEQGRQ